MKKLIAILIISLLCYSAEARNLMVVGGGVPVEGGSSLVKTDSFTGDENPLSTNWSTAYGEGSVKKSSGVVQSVTNATISAAYWDADSFNANQYSQVLVKSASYNFDGPCVRLASDTAKNGICAVHGDPDTIEISNLSDESTLATRDCGSTLTDATVKISISGTGASKTVKVYRNGVQCGADLSTSAGTDTGQPGIVEYYNIGNGIDDWEGGNL
jgi:hypothetical protein